MQYDIKGQYLYNLKTGETIGVRKDKEVDGAQKNGETVNVTDGHFYSKDFDIIGNHSTEGIQYGTVEDLSFDQIVDLFLQGNLTYDELEIGLEAKGVDLSGNTGTSYSDKRSVVFMHENKTYHLSCTYDAIKSQIDDKTVENYKNNISVDTERYKNCLQQSAKLFVMSYFDYDPPTTNRIHELTSEQIKFVNSHPEMFHMTIDEKTRGIAFDDYIMKEPYGKGEKYTYEQGSYDIFGNGNPSGPDGSIPTGLDGVYVKQSFNEAEGRNGVEIYIYNQETGKCDKTWHRYDLPAGTMIAALKHGDLNWTNMLDGDGYGADGIKDNLSLYGNNEKSNYCSLLLGYNQTSQQGIFEKDGKFYKFVDKAVPLQGSIANSESKIFTEVNINQDVTVYKNNPPKTQKPDFNVTDSINNNSATSVSTANNEEQTNVKVTPNYQISNVDFGSVDNISNSEIRNIKNELLKEFWQNLNISYNHVGKDDYNTWFEYSTPCPPIYSVDLIGDNVASSEHECYTVSPDDNQQVVFGDRFKDALRAYLKHVVDDGFKNMFFDEQSAHFSITYEKAFFRMLGIPEVEAHSEQDARDYFKMIQTEYLDNAENLDKLVENLCTSMGSTDGKTVLLEKYYDTLAKYGVYWSWSSTDKELFHTEEDIVKMADLRNLAKILGENLPDDKNYWASHIEYLATNKIFSQPASTVIRWATTEASKEGFMPQLLLAAGINSNDTDSEKEAKMQTLLEKIGIIDVDYNSKGKVNGGSVELVTVIKYLLGNNPENVDYFRTYAQNVLLGNVPEVEQSTSNTKQTSSKQTTTPTAPAYAPAAPAAQTTPTTPADNANDDFDDDVITNIDVETDVDVKFAPTTDIEDDGPEVIATPEEYKKEAESNVNALQKKVGNVIKDGDSYYNSFNGKQYNYLWDPFNHKWLAYEPDQIINGKAVDSENKNLERIQMILIALQQGLTFTVNPKVCKDNAGNYYDYDELKGIFVKR